MARKTETDMVQSRYTLSELRRHSASIRTQGRSALREQFTFLGDAFDAFDGFIAGLEKEPVSLERNVRLLLACKFFNHCYSGILLAENGLITDAVACERNALETLAFYRLVCLDPNAAAEYSDENMPRPVEVRKRLEKLGATNDLAHIRELYSSSSEVLHVSRASERFHTTLKSAFEGKLHFGGAFSQRDQEEMLRFFGALLFWFKQPIEEARAI